MTLYKVVWEIEIESDTPEAAAKTARSWLLDPGAQCVVFGVTDITDGNPYPEIQQDQLIDLVEGPGEEDGPWAEGWEERSQGGEGVQIQ